MYDVYRDFNIDARCFDIIDGFKALLPLRLNFSDVEVVGLEVDDAGWYDEDRGSYRGWKYTLKTIICTDYADKSALTDALEEGRAVGGEEVDLLSGENCRTIRKKYEVCWQFCEQFGNEAQYRLQGGTMKGPLSLEFVDYGVFKVCSFRILLEPFSGGSPGPWPQKIECDYTQRGEYDAEGRSGDSSNKDLLEFVQPDLLRVKSYRFLGEEKAVFDDD